MPEEFLRLIVTTDYLAEARPFTDKDRRLTTGRHRSNRCSAATTPTAGYPCLR